jgi:hypothetical protein
MTYLNPDALVAMKRDLSAWYDRALAVARSDAPPVPPTTAAATGQGPN